MKFGGTSVESAAAIQRVASIVQARESRRPVVVVSAMGKTTNKLLAIDGYSGVKTGTTTAAGACLVAWGELGGRERIVVRTRRQERRNSGTRT
jgi:aspartokinase